MTGQEIITTDEMITKALTQFSVNDAMIAQAKAEYLPLIVSGVNDDAGYKVVHAARMKVVKARTGVEATRKELKAGAIKYNKAIDEEAKRLTGLLAPIENHLEDQEKIVDDEKARIKAEAEAKEAARIQARIDRLFAIGCTSNGVNYFLQFSPSNTIPLGMVKVSSDEQFAKICADFQILADAEKERIAQEAAEKKAQEEVIAKVRAEQEAKQKELDDQFEKQQQAAAKLKADQLAVEAEKKRLADAEAARVKAIQDEKDRIEAEKLRAEELEKAKKEAAEKAVKDAEAKAKADAIAKAKAEEKAKKEAERRAARRPDKEKLAELADFIENIKNPVMKTQDGEDILAAFNSSICLAVKELREKVEEM